MRALPPPDPTNNLPSGQVKRMNPLTLALFRRGCSCRVLPPNISLGPKQDTVPHYGDDSIPILSKSCFRRWLEIGLWNSDPLRVWEWRLVGGPSNKIATFLFILFGTLSEVRSMLPV